MCILYLITKQRELGSKLIQYAKSKTTSETPNEINSIPDVIENLWREFYANYQKLQSAGIEDDNYYSHVQDVIMQFSLYHTDWIKAENREKFICNCNYQEKDNYKVDRYVENLKKFQRILHEKRENVACCEYPQIIADELESRFEILEEDFNNASLDDDIGAREEFNEVINYYVETLTVVNEEIHKREQQSPEKELPVLEAEGACCLQKEEVLFENIVDNIQEDPTLNIKDPDNIKLLIESAASCLRSITKMGLTIEATERLIARIILRNLDKEAFQLCKSRIMEQNQVHTLENVINFLGNMIIETQKDLAESINSPYQQHPASMQTNSVSTENTNEEKEELLHLIQNSLSDDGELPQAENEVDTATTENIANGLVNDFHNAAIEKAQQQNLAGNTNEEKEERIESKQNSLSDDGELPQAENEVDTATTENIANGFVNDFHNAAIEKAQQQNLATSDELLSIPMALPEKHYCMKDTLRTKPKDVRIYFPPIVKTISKDTFFKIFSLISELYEGDDVDLFTHHLEGSFEIRVSSSANSYSKRETLEILESHIDILRDGISLRTRYMGRKITLNLHTPGLSEPQIREHYASVDIPTSFKAFVTPLLEKTQTFLHTIIIFPEDE